MKEINIAFDLVQERFPSWGDYVCLCEVVKNKKYSNSVIKKAYKKFVKDCLPCGIKENNEYIDYLILQTSLKK